MFGKFLTIYNKSNLNFIHIDSEQETYSSTVIWQAKKSSHLITGNMAPNVYGETWMVDEKWVKSLPWVVNSYK